MVRNKTKTPLIGLALSGGTARGIAHVGVLQALVENQIPIDFIAGTSAGALVGGLIGGRRGVGYGLLGGAGAGALYTYKLNPKRRYYR